MNVLVIAAHPDDETLGMGGTIARHVAIGDIVTVATFTNGVSSKFQFTPKPLSDYSETGFAVKRNHEFMMASRTLMFKPISFDFPDQQLDIVPIIRMATKLEMFIDFTDIVYTHSINDLNQDHSRLHYATLIAFRPKVGLRCKEIYCYYVPSPGNTKFNSTMYVPLTQAETELKLAALECYQSILNDRFNRQSILRIMEECGNSIGVNYAEAFEIIRIIK